MIFDTKGLEEIQRLLKCCYAEDIEKDILLIVKSIYQRMRKLEEVVTKHIEGRCDDYS